MHKLGDAEFGTLEVEEDSFPDVDRKEMEVGNSVVLVRGWN